MTQRNDSLDLSQIFSLSYEEIQQQANKLLQSSDPKQVELGKAVLELPRDYFELSAGQKKLQELLVFLKDAGYTDNELWIIIQDLIKATVNIAEDKLYAKMNTELQQKWKDFLATYPNVYQQSILLNFIAKQITGQGLDDLIEDALTSIVTSVQTVLEAEITTAVGVSQLSEEDVAQVNQYFDTGKYLEAFDLIYNSSK